MRRFRRFSRCVGLAMLVRCLSRAHITRPKNLDVPEIEIRLIRVLDVQLVLTGWNALARYHLTLHLWVVCEAASASELSRSREDGSTSQLYHVPAPHRK